MHFGVEKISDAVQSLIITSYNISETLRALYLGDNYFENVSPELGKLRNLQIVRLI